MTYFFHPNAVRDMLIAQKRLRDAEEEIIQIERSLTKKKTDREYLKTYIRNHKQIR